MIPGIDIGGTFTKEQSLEEMLSPGPELHANTHYGFSVTVEQIDGQTFYWHPGGAGFSSIYLYYPEDGLTVAVLANAMVDLMPTAAALHQAYLEQQR